MSQIQVTYIDSMGSDLSVVNAARVSFGKKSELVEGGVGEDDYGEYIEMVLSKKDTKLVKYLAKHEHFSPFNHCFASFHVKAPIFVARQLVKHEYLPWNEISRRYVDDGIELYWPETIRERTPDKKQGSGGPHPTVNHGVGTGYYQALKEDVEEQVETYVTLIEKGVCPEQARMILPQNVFTEWYWSGSLGAFAKMCNLRLKEDTQYESRLVAQQIDEKMAELFPVSWSALVNMKEKEDV